MTDYTKLRYKPDLFLSFPVDEEHERLVVPVPMIALWHVTKALRKLTLEEAHMLVQMASAIANVIHLRKDIPPEDRDLLFDATWQRLDNLLNPDLNRLGEGGEPANEEDVLRFTYVLLRYKRITREQAAAIATDLLGKQELINKDAWRFKVDRWADRQNPKLPPVEIRKRGKKGGST